jgi:hypothetical protein
MTALSLRIGSHDEDTVVDLVFEHWELSRENMEMFIAPQGIKSDALVGCPHAIDGGIILKFEGVYTPAITPLDARGRSTVTPSRQSWSR